MRSATSTIDRAGKRARKAAAPARLLLLTFAMAGCGGSVTSTPTNTVTAPTGPQTYFAPIVAGTTYRDASNPPTVAVLLNTPLVYSIDDTALAFSQLTYQPVFQPGPQVLNAGGVAIGPRGLRSLGITANYAYDGGIPGYVPVPYNPALPGSFAVELANQAGGLVQLVGQPAAPITAATACPSSKAAQSYLFVTIPGGLSAASGNQYGWDRASETAYGVVQVAASGNAGTPGNITLGSIQQFALPPSPGAAAPPPAQAGPTSITGTCASTLLGYTTVIPGQLVIGNPKVGSGSIPPQATLAIGPTGLLVEDNGSNATTTLPDTSPTLNYNNVLGAGTGAVGLPQPTSPLGTSAVVGAQYVGGIYGAGVWTSTGAVPKGWSSHVASFGFSTVPSSCASVTPSTSTLIYGGDFPNDNPSASASGFGNCDFAIDLGTQSSSTNGLYPNATVWIGSAYAANTSAKTYSFPAVAIAGQLGGKYAIFVLGADTTQPWAIYLMQSN